MKKISVCIVTYNSEHYILSVLNCIYNYSKNFDLEVFIVDNNSTDSTLDLIRNKFSQANVIKLSKNIGFGHAHNQVLNKLNSDFHVILNPDITFSTNIFGELSEFLVNNLDVAMVMPNILNDDGSIQYLPKLNPNFKYLVSSRLVNVSKNAKKLRDEYTLKNKIKSTPIEVDFCSGCFIMIRTQVYKKLNGFDERFFMYFEDADLTRRAKKYGKTMFLPQISATHNWERASSKSFKYFFIHIGSMIKYFYKWHKK